MIDFTTVVAVDAQHLEELRLVWPTWQAFRPEIMQHPLLLICDGEVTHQEWSHQLSFLGHPNCQIELWSMQGVAQRDKMLSGLVLATAKYVNTPWYLKLDTDTAAIASDEWLLPKWFEPDAKGRRPVFVTNPWGYTKPPDAIERLDRWGDTVPALQGTQRLNLRPQPGSGVLRHRRIISWCFFGNTTWTREMASYCPNGLPVASQDTFLWYCAVRRGDFFYAVRMANFGWRHISHRRRLQKTCRQVLAQHGVNQREDVCATH